MKKNIKKMMIALCCTAFSAFLAVGLAGCSKTLPQWIREQQCGEHEWDDGEVTKEATCTEEGETLFTCTECGKTETQPRAMLPHNEQEVAEVSSTCTAVGYTDGVQCVDCETWIVGHDEIPMKEHNIVEQEAVEATCLTKGMTEGSYCSTCETVFAEQEVIAALGHQIVVKGGYAATCTIDGMTQGQECTRCGKVYLAQEVIEATGHSLQKLEGFAATCTASGLTDGEKCTKCGKVTVAQEVIPATDHTVQTLEGYEATCTERGLTEGERCTTCGKTLVVQTEIAAFGHREKVLPAVAVTCTESGLTSGEECLHCGTTLKAQEVIEATGHTIVTVEGYAATCTETGLTDGQKCSTCETVITAQTEIEAVEHMADEDGLCVWCSNVVNYELAVAGLEETDVVIGESVAGNWYRIYIVETTSVGLDIQLNNGWSIGGWANSLGAGQAWLYISPWGYSDSARIENVYRGEGYVDFYVPVGVTVVTKKQTGPDTYRTETMTFDETITISSLNMPEGFSIKRLA